MIQRTYSINVEVVVANNGNTGWDGSTSKDGYGNKTVALNNSYFSAQLHARELAAHEFGHTHGLNDVPCWVLMISSGYVGSSYPTVHDIEGINALY